MTEERQPSDPKADKVKELAEKLSNSQWAICEEPKEGITRYWSGEFERILRVELEPLLEAVKRVTDGTQPEEWRRNDTALLAAELQGWRKEK